MGNALKTTEIVTGTSEPSQNKILEFEAPSWGTMQLFNVLVGHFGA